MDDLEKTLFESQRLTANSHRALKEIKELLRQSDKIIQQGRAAILNSKSTASD